MADGEDKLAEFMSITGAESETALQYLKLTDYHLDQAVNLFMESGGGADADISGNAHSTQAALGSEEVRAPDQATRERLVGDEGFQIPMRRLQDRNRDFVAESIAALTAAANGHGTNQVASAFSFPPGAAAMAEGASEHTRDLSALFQPPINIMFKGTYSDARNASRSEGKWLLVNIQDEIVFASHMLNRDTWSDDMVQNVVQSGFVFWQNYWVSEQGRKFCTLYRIERDSLPLIAIIDPKSGEIAQSWNGFISSEALTEKLSDFCYSHPIEPADKSATEATEATETPKDVTDMPEEDQLAAAIAASMEDDGRTTSRSMSVESDETKEEEENQVVETLPPEPDEGGADVTRIQIRAPDGARLTRRFLKSDSIAMLWTFVKEQIPEARTRSFELRTTFPPSAVAFSDEHSLADCQLENASLMVKWL